MGDGSDEVARYYDRNTRRFLTFGRGRRSRAIHRELWGPGVSSPDEALAYGEGLLERLIVDRVGVTAPMVVDLGCGVGGTLLHLAERFPDAGLRGITVSGAQHRIATRLIREMGLDGRCRVDLGDFQQLPGEGEADLVVAIESYGHAESPDAFLGAASSHLRPGGVLAVLDDFVAVGAEAEPEIATFRRGWRLPSLGTVHGLREAALARGLAPVEDVDLTAMVPLTRPRDRAVAVVAPLVERLGLVGAPFFANLIGGNALRRGLLCGTIEYRMIVLEKREGRDD